MLFKFPDPPLIDSPTNPVRFSASNPAFGREVYFHPKGYTDESYIGTPLNKAAVDGLKLSHLTPNVTYSVKEGVVLNETVQIGMISN